MHLHASMIKCTYIYSRPKEPLNLASSCWLCTHRNRKRNCIRTKTRSLTNKRTNHGGRSEPATRSIRPSALKSVACQCAVAFVVKMSLSFPSRSSGCSRSIFTWSAGLNLQDPSTRNCLPWRKGVRMFNGESSSLLYLFTP